MTEEAREFVTAHASRGLSHDGGGEASFSEVMRSVMGRMERTRAYLAQHQGPLHSEREERSDDPSLPSPSQGESK